MSNKKKNSIFSNPWTIGIGTTIVSVFLLRVIDRFTGSTIVNSVISWLAELPVSLWNSLTREYHLALYWLIVIFISGPILAILALWMLAKSEDKAQINQGKQPGQQAPPEWLNYLRDIFDTVQYRWTYEKNAAGQFEIWNIRALCPKCDCLLIDNKCPNCNQSYYWVVKGTDQIKALILHRLEKNYGVNV